MMADDYFRIPDPVQEAPAARKKFRTHYDNLKVSRNATESEIRASYRRLCSLHHPDRNGSPSAENAIRCINEAYEILSDDAKRAKHDAWIMAEDRRLNPPSPVYRAPAAPPKPKQTQQPQDLPGWNPEHALAFAAFLEAQRVKWGSGFNGLLTDRLYSIFLNEMRTKEAVAKAQDNVREAKILVLCCCLTILLAAVYFGFLLLNANGG